MLARDSSGDDVNALVDAVFANHLAAEDSPIALVKDQFDRQILRRPASNRPYPGFNHGAADKLAPFPNKPTFACLLLR